MFRYLLSVITCSSNIILRHSFVEMAVPQIKSSSPCYRLGLIKGHKNKENEVILCCNPHSIASESHIIFFGGDVQDYKEDMLSYLPHKPYVEWNLETTAQILHNKFPNSMIWVIRPQAKLHSTFSLYNNFLASRFDGAPDFSKTIENQESWAHLITLFRNAVKKGKDFVQASQLERVKLTDDCDKESRSNCPTVECDSMSWHIPELPLHIIGFSKGCVVLNQLLYDLKYILSESDKSPEEFVHNIHLITWLDGGHAGGKNTWITDRQILNQLKQFPKLRVNVHVTPYQVKDELRPWIGREQRQFTRTLRDLGVAVEEKLHFTEEEPSLENHFKVLEEF